MVPISFQKGKNMIQYTNVWLEMVSKSIWVKLHIKQIFTDLEGLILRKNFWNSGLSALFNFFPFLSVRSILNIRDVVEDVRN